jgi:hypothetical protein
MARNCHNLHTAMEWMEKNNHELKRDTQWHTLHTALQKPHKHCFVSHIIVASMV